MSPLPVRPIRPRLAVAPGGKDDGEVTLTVVRDRKQRTVRVKPERGGPQGILINPGAFGGVAPVAAAPPRAVLAPGVVVVPRAMSVPRAFTAPRVRVSPARVRVLGLGDRVL